eukprot:TRINITY_DN8615_c0_g1_i1.p1 TRINITY_DN8615_c0_g1~~TRINITY_DN8615_c0_g1_i1.p1  ORF type:complete len:118 (+),score=3.89 TRINITY_DN8615_c0_g1_i1:26-379(+)
MPPANVSRRAGGQQVHASSEASSARIFSSALPSEDRASLHLAPFPVIVVHFVFQPTTPTVKHFIKQGATGINSATKKLQLQVDLASPVKSSRYPPQGYTHHMDITPVVPLIDQKPSH